MILILTGILIFTVLLRGSASKTFYQYRKSYVNQSRLKKQLWQNQLALERLTSPANIARLLEGYKPDADEKD